jgi:DNA-binding NarL/FixJ family response regulator
MTDSPSLGAGRTIGVLVCDDVDALRRLVRVVIELDPSLAVVGEARDGRQAILEAERLQPDVVLLDLSMPVLNGIEALPAIREVAPETRVIVFTGLSSPALERLVLDGGAHRFLPKGASPDAITDAIKDVYASGRVRDERERIASPEGRV